jgi:hypothetical protein
MPKSKMSFEDWTTEALGRLAGYFNLDGWRLEVEYQEKEETLSIGTSASLGVVYAKTYVDSTYQAIHVILYKQAKYDFETGNFEQLATGLTHELVHVFLDPLNDFSAPFLSETTAPFFQDILERQTQKLTMIFLKTMPAEIFSRRMSRGKHN